jgi:hypothetical protein
MQKKRSIKSLCSGELKILIKEKFGTVKKFYSLVGMSEDLNKIYYELTNETDARLKAELYLLYLNTDNTLSKLELDDNLKNIIREKMKKPVKGLVFKNMRAFCSFYKFKRSWMSRILSSEPYSAKRADTKKVKRLLQILNIKIHE